MSEKKTELEVELEEMLAKHEKRLIESAAPIAPEFLQIVLLGQIWKTLKTKK